MSVVPMETCLLTSLCGQEFDMHVNDKQGILRSGTPAKS
jgi:hypothetical protein